MKKIIKFLAAVFVIYFITAAALETNSDSDVMYQTWDEFLESGVKIEYGEVTAITDNEPPRCKQRDIKPVKE